MYFSGAYSFLNIADKYETIFTCSISEQIANYEIQSVCEGIFFLHIVFSGIGLFAYI